MLGRPVKYSLLRAFAIDAPWVAAAQSDPCALPSNSAEVGAPLSSLLGRLLGVAVLISLELLAITLWVSHIDLTLQGGWMKHVLTWIEEEWLFGGTVIRSAIAFVAAFLGFGLLTVRSAFRNISRELTRVPISRGLLVAHVCAWIVFWGISYRLFMHPRSGGQMDFYTALWLATGLAGVVLACFAVVPFRLVVKLIQHTGNLWVLAAITGFAAGWSEKFRHLLWQPLIGLTIDVVTVCLRPWVADLTINRATGTLASHHFLVIVSPECSGLQGAGMMLGFSVAWIWVFRRECRFPHALILIPVSISTVWLLNSVRLVVLFLIGNMGAPGIAMGGFHSQAGWIAFSGVALGFTMVLQRVPGMTKTCPAPARPAKERTAANPAACYLVPFLVILAAGMVSRAASDGFEWLYPLRFVAATTALWHFRRKYTALDWRISWAAPLVGSIVFVMWLALDATAAHVPVSAIGTGLASLSGSLSGAWIVVRVLAASVTVPIAEELAFRGFLLRRLVSPAVETVRSPGFTWMAILISSIAFGVLHGNRWLAGTFAGVFFALAFRHRGRMGDAVAAHGITNLLLAAWVLFTHNWNLW